MSDPQDNALPAFEPGETLGAWWQRIQRGWREAELAQAVAQARADERAACIAACLGEQVDAQDTQDEGDFIYNRACADCAGAIRERG